MEKRDRKGRRSEGSDSFVYMRLHATRVYNDGGMSGEHCPISRPFSILWVYDHVFPNRVHTCEIFPLEMSETIRFAHRHDEKG